MHKHTVSSSYTSKCHIKQERKFYKAENNSNGYQPEESAKTATSVSTDSRNRKITKTTAPVSDASIYSSIEAGFMQPSSASDMRRVRIGCFFIFAVVILIFLFVLFGLPYLLY